MLNFIDIGISPILSRICKAVGLRRPTKIQALTIPYALKGRDVLGFSHTGSGKTLAFILPIFQIIIMEKKSFFSLIITPSREIAFQIAGQCELIGSIFGIKVATLVGGLKNSIQASMLSSFPQIVIATPGRLVENIIKKGIRNLKKLRFLVFDEGDRLFQPDFEKEITVAISELPSNRQCLIFSASVLSNNLVLELLKLKNPIRIILNKKSKLCTTLIQNYIYSPFKVKDCYLIFLCNQFSGCSMVIFSATKTCVEKLALLLRLLGFEICFIHGEINQTKRLKIIGEFKSGEKKVLISTDLASRGLDIPGIELIINYDLPVNVKTYLHRVGRTARNGASGRAISLVTQYDIRSIQKIENYSSTKIEEYKHDFKEISSLLEISEKAKDRASKLFKLTRKKKPKL